MEQYTRTRKRRSPVRKRVFWALLIFLLILLGIGLFKASSFLPVLWELFFTKEVQLKETKDKKVNVLLLGVGGANHDGPNLTDTIIFTSVDPQQKKVSLVSIPRDLWVPEMQQKINQSYVVGEDKKAGTGLASAKEIVSTILGQQIDYVVKIDFSGFEKAVDAMGGLDITVARTFDDYAYPIAGLEDEPCGHDEITIASLSAQIASGSASESEAFPCRYEHLHFDKGETHMDGETALKYVRSRHAFGFEGSDFARSQRQSKVISAFREKLFSAGTLLNLSKVNELLAILQGSIEMDIKKEEIDDFVKLANKTQGAKVVSAVLDTGDEEEERLGLLTNPPISEEYNNAWVLAPRAGNGEYSEIHEYVSCFLSGKTCLITETGVATPTPTVTPRKTVTPES